MKRKFYGIQYAGGKGQFCERILAQLPPAKHFFDMFAGGCAVSHCALLSGRYEWIHASDIADGPRLFLDACAGKYASGPVEIIDRADFADTKVLDPFVRFVWSFGANGESYAFGDVSGAVMRAVCGMLLGDTLDDRYAAWKAFVREFQAIDRSADAGAAARRVSALSHCECVVPVDHVRRLRALAGTDTTRMDFRQVSYEEVDVVSTDSVLYCDIPYKGVMSPVAFYNKCGFDFERFYDWALTKRNIYISEYEMPDAFVPVWTMQKGHNFSGGRNAVSEKLFIPRANLEEYMETMRD